MFSGAGMLHQVQIANGAATYSNTYIRTPRFEIERAAGGELYGEVTDVAGGGLAGLERIQMIERKKQQGLIPNLSPLELTPGSTAIQYHHGDLYCLQESGYAFKLAARIEGDRLILDGRGELETWNGQWHGPFSAHPRIDPDNGDLYNLSIDAAGAIIAGHVASGLVRRQTSVHQQDAGGRMGYLHDFFLTEHHLVFPDISLRVDPTGLLGPTGSVFSFNPARPLRWGVLSRDFTTGDTVRWFETDAAGSMWHVVNAWEEHDDTTDRTCIVLYAPMYPSYPSDLPIHTPEEPHARLTRWVLDLAAGTVTEARTLLDHGYERPSLNLDRVGRPSRYGYLLDEEADGYMGKGVLKYDLTNHTEAGYFGYGDLHGGEALFVPKSGATLEDDGYLLDLLMGDTDAALIVIDASTMQEVARLHLPQRVPFGVHACWLDAIKMETIAARSS
jgi:carotenoid cleavage dioxygenase